MLCYFNRFSNLETGMWALFKWKKYKALRELVLEDAIGGNSKKTLLYKLSENGMLSHFKKIVLIASPKDHYIPMYSGRIQVGMAKQLSVSNNCMPVCFHFFTNVV
jgi:hypothetical protein